MGETINIQRISGEPIIIHSGDVRTVICCDCGLAHTYFYRFVKRKKKLVIEMIGFRDDYENDWL